MDDEKACNKNELTYKQVTTGFGFPFYRMAKFFRPIAWQLPSHSRNIYCECPLYLGDLAVMPVFSAGLRVHSHLSAAL